MKSDKIEKIKYKDLSLFLQISIIGGFLMMVGVVFSFISGFLS